MNESDFERVERQAEEMRAAGLSRLLEDDKFPNVADVSADTIIEYVKRSTGGMSTISRATYQIILLEAFLIGMADQRDFWRDKVRGWRDE